MHFWEIILGKVTLTFSLLYLQMHFWEMILGEVTLSIRLTIFTDALLGNNLRESNSYI